MVDNRLSFKEISQLIEGQFPAVYREEGETFVAFLKAYYEWLETAENSSYNEGRELIKISDIDNTLDKFLGHFKETYLNGFPFDTNTDTRFLIKHIMDFYRTKGTKQSTELLMKLMFGEEVQIYYPGQDVLKPSDSQWKVPQYLEVSTSDRTSQFVDKKITGSISGATAFVESVVRKRVDGKLIDIIYISTVKGSFITGDFISDSGDVTDAPIMIGSLTRFEVESGGRNNKIGDVFDVIANGAMHGKVRVTGTEDATGRVDFIINDGGNGYTKDTMTKVYVSNTVLGADLSGVEFLELEKVYQPIEKASVISALTLNETAVAGDDILGVDSSNTVIAEGTVLSVVADGANSDLTILATTGTFLDQVKIVASAPPTGMIVGETIDEERKSIFTISTSANTIIAGQKVEQFTYHPDDPTLVTSYAEAIVESVSGFELTVNSYFGEFKIGSIVVNDDFMASLSSIVDINVPAFATITDITGSEISVSDITGAFDAGSKVRTRRSRQFAQISSVTTQGASDVILTKNGATGVVDVTENNWLNGVVIGQNTTAFGISGSNEFFVSDSFPVYVYTDRTGLLSPPMDSNGEIIELKIPVTTKSTGTAAKFSIGKLAAEQTVTVATDFVSDHNIFGIPFLEVRLDGNNSGGNRVQSFVVDVPGSGYSNGDIVTVTGGGYGGSEPYISSTGSIVTDGLGAITEVSLIEPGSGFYETPTVVLPSTAGAVATVSVVMRNTYGFPSSISGNQNTILQELLGQTTVSIGKIASLSSINPGINYNVDPFIKVHNKTIASFERGDYVITVSGVEGGFQEGERLIQIVDTNTFEKGTVISYDSLNNVVFITRTLFETDFNYELPIIGEVSGSIANIVSVDRLDQNIFGENADITGRVIAANGVITSVEVIDSGYGYVNGPAELVSETNPFAVSGSVLLGKHGKGTGYWKTTTSHLNSEKKIHDNKYYQEYSYDIISSLALNRYADILKSVTHVAGTRMFGSIARNTVVKLGAGQGFQVEIIQN